MKTNMAPDNATRFENLFGPRHDVYGIAKGKVERATWGRPIMGQHLQGNHDYDLGFFPLRDDGTVRFAAIDLDEPDFGRAREIAELIPGNAWVERSRSGNAHVWVFFSDDCPAWVARGQLRKVLELMDLPRVEIFPKQAELIPGMVGNYISAPYFGDQRPMVWQSMMAALQCHNEYSLERFLTEAEASTIDPQHWHDLCIRDGIEPPRARGEGSDEFGSRPAPHMCATYMLEHKDDNPLTPGHRATVLFNLAKQLANVQDFEPAEVEDMVEAMNRAGTDPVSSKEVERFVRNAYKGQWVSTGCDDPLMDPYVDPDCPIARHG